MCEVAAFRATNCSYFLSKLQPKIFNNKVGPQSQKTCDQMIDSYGEIIIRFASLPVTFDDRLDGSVRRLWAAVTRTDDSFVIPYFIASIGLQDGNSGLQPSVCRRVTASKNL
jgi:hypothetical protein